MAQQNLIEKEKILYGARNAGSHLRVINITYINIYILLYIVLARP